MALQLRRGTDAERSAVTFADGELVYTTDTKKLYVGDGATAGGNSITALTTTLDGELTGSVFGDDSTLIVDGNNNSINTSLISSVSGLSLLLGSDLTVTRTNTPVMALINNQPSADLTAANTLHGVLVFKTTDSNGTNNSAIFGSSAEGITISKTDGSYALPDSNKFYIGTNGKFGVGTLTPTTKLDVAGEGRFTGFVQFGSLTTVQRDALTAANGMVIYNSTDNKFQGYEAGAWINLV